MSSRICRYCKVKSPSSREHLIANTRLIRINSFKEKANSNDNIQKIFKGITCEDCNNKLGVYEESNRLNLAYATIWKLLAGNFNDIFQRRLELASNNTPLNIISFFEGVLFDLIKAERILPLNTFSFDLDPLGSELYNKFSFATKKIVIKPVDESGLPIEGVKVFTKDKGGGTNERGYIATSNTEGEAELNILTAIEAIRVIKDTIIINSSKDHDGIEVNFDTIIYLSHDSNSKRIVVILPLLHSIPTKLGEVIIDLYDKTFFLKSFQRAFPELGIISIKEIFTKTPNKRMHPNAE